MQSSVSLAIRILSRPERHISSRRQAGQAAKDLWFNLSAAQKEFPSFLSFAEAVSDAWPADHEFGDNPLFGG